MAVKGNGNGVNGPSKGSGARGGKSRAQAVKPTDREIVNPFDEEDSAEDMWVAPAVESKGLPLALPGLDGFAPAPSKPSELRKHGFVNNQVDSLADDELVDSNGGGDSESDSVSSPYTEVLGLPFDDEDWSVTDVDTPRDEPVTVGDSIEDILGALGSRSDDDYDGDAYSDAEVQGFSGDSIDSIIAMEDSASESGYGDDWDLDGGDYDEVDEDPFQGFSLDNLLALAIDSSASDVHLKGLEAPRFSRHGDIERVVGWGDSLSSDVIQRVQQSIVNHQLGDRFVQDMTLDTSYVLRAGKHKGRRTRLNVSRSMSDVTLTFRIIDNVIPSVSQLALEPELVELCTLNNGLVLINGPTGTGKTTIIASVLRHNQLQYAEKIITLEKPIEYVYDNDGVPGFVVQREIGGDARSFRMALDAAMREAPNRILVGEVRNQEEVDAALYAAESGHWTISTIHASSSPTSISRIMQMYSGEELRRILGSLSDNLRGMCNQVLLKRADGNGRVGVREILLVDSEIERMVREGDTKGMRDYQVERRITLEDRLALTVAEGVVTREAARQKAMHRAYFDERLKELG